jgi:hypothetical protein
MVHGRRAVDAWIDALVAGNFRIGVIYPLAKQAEMGGCGTLILNAARSLPPVKPPGWQTKCPNCVRRISS